MTETEKKALALLNEICVEMGLDKVRSLEVDMPGERALLRAIEQHEAFRQEVSDAVESLCNTVLMSHGHRQLREMLSRRFIIAKSDPLVEVMNEMGFGWSKTASEEFRAALAARGLEIREKQP